MIARRRWPDPTDGHIVDLSADLGPVVAVVEARLSIGALPIGQMFTTHGPDILVREHVAPCETCKEVFTVHLLSRGTPPRYCSPTCRREARRIMQQESRRRAKEERDATQR